MQSKKICELLLMTETTKNLSRTSHSFTAAGLCIKAPNHPSVHARILLVLAEGMSIGLGFMKTTWWTPVHSGLWMLVVSVKLQPQEVLWANTMYQRNHQPWNQSSANSAASNPHIIIDVDSKSAWWHHCITMMPSCSLCMAIVPHAQWLWLTSCIRNASFRIGENPNSQLCLVAPSGYFLHSKYWSFLS